MPFLPYPSAPSTPEQIVQWDALNRLRAAISRSGLTNTAFARTVLVRDPRSLRRWLAGAPMPQSILHWLERNAHEVPNH